ncbi:hypothetical protein MLD38_007281 [Melastoma candidum]|uniref:Uncharacterized protein n=1 Tax=Melastoma candidum TaxID=119954 RepID=A0ACB9RQL4_9MYRT|nr:hypothetical protein MLD38_007281 [Melastoma candidum]
MEVANKSMAGFLSRPSQSYAVQLSCQYYWGPIVLFVHLKPDTSWSRDRNDSALEMTDLMQMKGYAGFKEFNQKTYLDKLLPGVSMSLGKLIVYNFKVLSDATLDFGDLCNG